MGGVPGAAPFWTVYRTTPSGYVPFSVHGAAEMAALAAMSPEDRRAFVERFNADTDVWEQMRAAAAARAAESPRLEKSDKGVDGFIPLPPVEGPPIGEGVYVSDAQWAEQNRRMNDILNGRDDYNSPRGGTLERRTEPERGGA